MWLPETPSSLFYLPKRKNAINAFWHCLWEFLGKQLDLNIKYLVQSPLIDFRHFGQNDVVKALISDNTYNECWNSMIKWIRNELDLGRSVKIPNMGLISVQIWNDD